MSSHVGASRSRKVVARSRFGDPSDRVDMDRSSLAGDPSFGAHRGLLLPDTGDDGCDADTSAGSAIGGGGGDSACGSESPLPRFCSIISHSLRPTWRVLLMERGTPRGLPIRAEDAVRLWDSAIK